MSEQEPTKNASVSEFIAFRIGEEEYCVDIMAVREIRGWTKATALPHAPQYVRGLINLRGTVLPIVDFACRLGQGFTDPQSRHVIIVMRIHEQTVGLLVDAVSDILTVSPDEFHATPDVASETARTFVKGVLALDGRMIRLIGLDQILAQTAAEAA